MKIPSTLLASALYGCLLPLSTASAMVSDDSCSSDADCPPNTYCALVVSQICEPDFAGGDCLSSDELEAEGVCAPLEADVSCTRNDDCGEGYHCEFSGALCNVFCPEDGDCVEDCSAAANDDGVCVEDYFIDNRECESDADCGAGERCEWFEWLESPDQQEDDVPTWGGGGYCVAEHEEQNDCWSEWDCGPGYRCEGFYGESCIHGEDGMYHCEEVDYPGTCVLATEPEPVAECYGDEDCGDGGVCITESYYYDCPEGVACMMPALPVEPGYCEYDDFPFVDDEEPPYCVVRIHDECVLYADDGTGLNCEATGASPTWLACLAIFGLLRRRKNIC